MYYMYEDIAIRIIAKFSSAHECGHWIELKLPRIMTNFSQFLSRGDTILFLGFTQGSQMATQYIKSERIRRKKLELIISYYMFG